MQQTAETIVGAMDDLEYAVLARTSHTPNIIVLGLAPADERQEVGLLNITACCTEVRPQPIEIAESAIIAGLERVPDGTRGA